MVIFFRFGHSFIFSAYTTRAQQAGEMCQYVWDASLSTQVPYYTSTKKFPAEEEQ